MPPPKVFISYSAKPCKQSCARTPPCAGAVQRCDRAVEETGFRDSLIQRLKARGAEPLFDGNQLFEGEIWREKLYPALAKCDAGVLLLTESAAASVYVPIEAMVLAWRRLLDASFDLIPVF